MSQFNVPVRRAGGGLDVYAALMFIAMVLLAAAVAVVLLKNRVHSDPSDSAGGSPIKIIQDSELVR